MTNRSDTPFIKLNPGNTLFLAECAVCKKAAQSACVCSLCDDAIESARLSKNIINLETNYGFKVLCTGSFLYEFDTVQKLLFFLKNVCNKNAVNYAASKMLRDIHCMELDGKTIFTNIPRKSTNIRKIGFDQSELLAKRIAFLYGENAVYSKLISRKPFSKEQKTLNKNQREKNLKNKFYINKFKKLFAGQPQNIVIIDDVLTTGTSISEAAKALKQAFPKSKISAAVLARR